MNSIFCPLKLKCMQKKEKKKKKENAKRQKHVCHPDPNTYIIKINGFP